MAGFNIGSMFRNTQQVTQPQPTQQQQPTGKPNSSLEAPAGGNNNQNSNSGGAGGGNSNSGGDGSQGANNDSPLDVFKDMWKTPENGGGTPTDPFAAPLFKMDPVKLREAAGQMDFMQSVPQELMQKVMAGNDPQALVALIQHVGQQSLATALQLSTATTEQAGAQLGQRFNTAMPTKFRDLQINSQQPINPVLNHPSAQPMLAMARNQIKMMNPDMSPQQIQQEAERYLSTFASTFQSQDPNALKPVAQPGEQQDQDWMSWAQQDTQHQGF